MSMNESEVYLDSYAPEEEALLEQARTYRQRAGKPKLRHLDLNQEEEVEQTKPKSTGRGRVVGALILAMYGLTFSLLTAVPAYMLARKALRDGNLQGAWVTAARLAKAGAIFFGVVGIFAFLDLLKRMFIG